MLAQDLRLSISLEPLGTWVPAHHPALRIKHVEGVVGHGLDEEAVFFLS